MSTVFGGVCVIFFFKQKTAYEMLISDWSSDVCSSDLARNWGPNREAPGADFGLLGMPFPGTIAEYVCVPADNLAPKPDFMSWEEAGAMPLTALTSWRALMLKGKLQAGETLLIHGVGGGVEIGRAAWREGGRQYV